MTQEEMSIEVLGKRSGYLKGFGHWPKPSSFYRSTTASQPHDEEVQDLKMRIYSLKEIVQSQQDEIRPNQAIPRPTPNCTEDAKFYDAIHKLATLWRKLSEWSLGKKILVSSLILLKIFSSTYYCCLIRSNKYNFAFGLSR